MAAFQSLAYRESSSQSSSDGRANATPWKLALGPKLRCSSHHVRHHVGHRRHGAGFLLRRGRASRTAHLFNSRRHRLSAFGKSFKSRDFGAYLNRPQCRTLLRRCWAPKTAESPISASTPSLSRMRESSQWSPRAGFVARGANGLSRQSRLYCDDGAWCTSSGSRGWPARLVMRTAWLSQAAMCWGSSPFRRYWPGRVARTRCRRGRLPVPRTDASGDGAARQRFAVPASRRCSLVSAHALGRERRGPTRWLSARDAARPRPIQGVLPADHGGRGRVPRGAANFGIAGIALVLAALVGGPWYVYKYLAFGVRRAHTKRSSWRSKAACSAGSRRSSAPARSSTDSLESLRRSARSGTWSLAKLPEVFLLPLVALLLLPLCAYASGLLRTRPGDITWAPALIAAPSLPDSYITCSRASRCQVLAPARPAGT